ncbi:MAG: hypothetical protein U0800_19095 [Isosphaeraceae bacterium]
MFRDWTKRWAKSGVDRQARRSMRRARPTVDALDSRQLMTADVTAVLNPAGTLVVSGTPIADRIEVAVSNDVLNWVVVRSGDTGLRIAGLFPRSSVHAVSVSGYGGNDTIRIDQSSRSISYANGGAAGIPSSTPRSL